MKNKEYLFIPNKIEYLKKNNITKMLSLMEYQGDVKCFHCEKIIDVLEYKVELFTLPPPSIKQIRERSKLKAIGMNFEPYSSEPKEFVVCPNSPECDGTMLDLYPS
jgi:hypothetical protein